MTHLRSLILSAAALCALLVPTSFALQTAAPAKAEAQAAKPSALASTIDALVAARAKAPTFSGLSIAVAQRGEVVFEKAYGLADEEFDVPANNATMFRIGSITKQFTAALVMLMVERGKLSLDDTLDQFVPQFPLHTSPLGRAVTVRQLLNHTSGIPSYTDLGAEWSAKWPLELSHEELLALVAGKPFDFEPGASWSYNNTGYYLLGMVLEKLSGKSYAQLVLDELATPLGLSRTRYDSNQELIKNRAQGYTLEGRVKVNDVPLGMNQPGAGGGLLSTAGDLVRWKLALRGGKVVSPESFALMTTPVAAADGTGGEYGFGLEADQFEGARRISHGGGIFGFNSMLSWFPESDVVVAVISNSEPESAGRLAAEIARAALGIQRPTPLDLPLSAELARELAGDYRIATLGLDVAITARDGKLFARAAGQGEFRLKFQGERSFRADFDASVRFEFAADGRSFTLHQGGGQFVATR